MPNWTKPNPQKTHTFFENTNEKTPSPTQEKSPPLFQPNQDDAPHSLDEQLYMLTHAQYTIQANSDKMRYSFRFSSFFFSQGILVHSLHPNEHTDTHGCNTDKKTHYLRSLHPILTSLKDIRYHPCQHNLRKRGTDAAQLPQPSWRWAYQLWAHKISNASTSSSSIFLHLGYKKS